MDTPSQHKGSGDLWTNYEFLGRREYYFPRQTLRTELWTDKLPARALNGCWKFKHYLVQTWTLIILSPLLCGKFIEEARLSILLNLLGHLLPRALSQMFSLRLLSPSQIGALFAFAFVIHISSFHILNPLCRLVWRKSIPSLFNACNGNSP